MKRVLAVAVALALVGLVAHNANAQIPNVVVYFDAQYYTQTQIDCQGDMVTQNWYIVANNLNTRIKAIEYAVQYPLAATHLADIDVPGAISFGTTDTGVATGYGSTPDGFLDAFQPALLMTVLVQWHCDTCLDPPGYSDQAVVVVPHLVTGFLRAVRWPDDFLMPLVGMTSIICPEVVPVEETSWGQLKALYDN